MADLPFRLTLASGSRGRRYLLEQAGYTFDIKPAAVEEPLLAGHGDARSYVHEIAWLKASAVAPLVGDGVVLAADTVGWLDGRPVLKPVDENDARRMLRSLAGRWHELWTGVVLWRRPDDLQLCWQACSRVHMKPMADEEIEAYLRTRLWEGCSGAYAVREDDPLLTVEGSVSNVIGLPIEGLAARLGLLGE